MWTQIVGKIRLALTPWINHSWHVTLYVTARGLTTSPMYVGARVLEIDFDFIDHVLRFQTGEGIDKTMRLAPKSVAAFYREVMSTIADLKVDVEINTTPNEVEPANPFD